MQIFRFRQLKVRDTKYDPKTTNQTDFHLNDLSDSGDELSLIHI